MKYFKWPPSFKMDVKTSNLETILLMNQTNYANIFTSAINRKNGICSEKIERSRP